MGSNTAQRAVRCFVGIALLVGACGGSDDDDTDVLDAAQNESAEESAEDAWCALLDKTDEVETIFDDAATLDPDDLEVAYGRVSEIVSDFRDAAPPEIRDDAAVLATNTETLIDAFEQADFNILDVDLSFLEDPIFQQETDAADRALDDYSLTTCGRTFGDASTDPIEPGDEPTDSDFDPAEGTVREQTIEALVSSGFTQVEAECLVEKIDITDPAAFTDITTLQQLFEECGISLDRLAELGG